MAALIGAMILMLACPSAVLAASHVFAKDITGSGTNAFTGPTDVDIDQATHDVYVTDPGHNRVVKFNSNGNFILMFGKGVNQTTGGDVCPVSPGDVCQAGTSTSSPGGFLIPTYIAVDNSSGPSAGDVYVGDTGNAGTVEGTTRNYVSKFDSSGHLITSWGVAGQKDGADAVFGGSLIPGVENLPIFGPLYGLGVNPQNGVLYIGGHHYNENQGEDVWLYTQDGKYIKWYGGGKQGLDVNGQGYIFTESSQTKIVGPGQIEQLHGLFEEIPEEPDGPLQNMIYHRIGTITPLTGLAISADSTEFYQDTGAQIDHFADCDYREHGPCPPFDTFGNGQLTSAKGVAIDNSAQTVYVANTGANDIAVFGDIRPKATTGPTTQVGETDATVSGHADLAGHGPIVKCEFEYGLTAQYGKSVPCEPDPSGTPFATATDVSVALSGLTPTSQLPVGSEYHYRLVIENSEEAIGFGADRTFTTIAAPTINSLSSSGVTATAAVLETTINPDNLDTSCYFEYGTTIEYGSTVPCVPASLGHGATPQSAAAHLTGLNGGTYHFRVVAENALGTAVSEDQTFEFFPPNCPNSAVRQQTSSSYLPDCRAYELVSPPEADGTLFYSAGPTSPYATNPSRLAFSGAFSSPPGADNTIGTVADLYVASRTPTGWTSHYVGPSGTETGCVGGPPNHPWTYYTHSDKLEDPVLADQSLSRILDFSLGTGYRCFLNGNNTSDGDNASDTPSNAGYLWEADGSPVTRLPTDASALPGAMEALACPTGSENSIYPHCTSDATASGDLHHFIFSSNQLAFAPGGLSAPPGSAYDEDLQTGTITLISTLLGGEPIPQDPAYATVPGGTSGNKAPGGPQEFIRFPGVSTDGSHILMSTATASTPFCGGASGGEVCPRFTDTPVHLYMSIDDQPAIEVSKSELSGENVAIRYVGMTPGGSRVYFTTNQKMTAGDLDTSVDLYMWSEGGQEAGHPLTLVSAAAPGSELGAGNSDGCEPALARERGKEVPWTTKCGVVPYDGWAYAVAHSGSGGNGTSDSGIASGNGDIFFYSPELLDHGHGFAGQENLYGYRDGEVHYILTLSPDRHCKPISGAEVCASGPIARLEVTPNDTRMAFVSDQQITAYENAGHLEMYFYTPSTGLIVCASCRPDGQPPTEDVEASQNGRFLTDDGRVFFSTTEPLTPRDTNRGYDVYEYTEGRPRLITPGTGTARTIPPGVSENQIGEEQRPGLIGVSADGTDVYFSTFDTLVAEDRNGSFLKFYDARTGGGFLRPAPTQPCAAAEECHGPGTEAPELPTQGTAAVLSGGNVADSARKARHGKRKRHHGGTHRHHRGHRGRRGRR